MNWYAIQTVNGQEEAVKGQAEAFMPEADFRLLYRIGEFKYQGEWVEKKLPIYPGYFFVVTDEPQNVRDGLRKVFRFCRVVEFDGELIPLTVDEAELLEKLSEGKEVIKMSKGVKIGDAVKVIDGPMKGFESRIIRIDRRKKLASLEFNVGDSAGKIELGLEVVSKS